MRVFYAYDLEWKRPCSLESAEPPAIGTRYQRNARKTTTTTANSSAKSQTCQVFEKGKPRNGPTPKRCWRID